jgi:hypothetical protein
MKAYLLLTALLSSFLLVTQEPALSQSASLGRRGCGAGCGIEITELSQPSDMGNGWKKLLIREQYFLMEPNGTWRKAFPNELRWSPTQQYWIFAHCSGTSFARGQRSDGSDATSESIYEDDGSKKTTSVSGNVYDQWEALCR